MGVGLWMTCPQEGPRVYEEQKERKATATSAQEETETTRQARRPWRSSARSLAVFYFGLVWVSRSNITQGRCRATEGAVFLII